MSKQTLPSAAEIVAAKIAKCNEYLDACSRAHTAITILRDLLPRFDGKVVNNALLKRLNAAMAEAGAPCGLSFRVYGWTYEPCKPNDYGVRAVFWDAAASEPVLGDVVYILANGGRLDAKRTAAAAVAFSDLMVARAGDCADRRDRFAMMEAPLQRVFDALTCLGSIEGSAHLGVEELFEKGGYLRLLQCGPLCRYSNDYAAIRDAESGRLN